MIKERADGEPENRKTLIMEFLREHMLAASPLVDRDEAAIVATLSALRALEDGLGAADVESMGDNAWAVLLDLVRRNAELALGAIAAHITGAGASADLVARGSVELSVTIGYIVQDINRLGDFFEGYIQEERRKLGRWRKMIDDNEEVLEAAAQQKQRYLDGLVNLTGSLRAELGLREPLAWPSVYDRFRRLGLEADYRTLYGALSGSSHGDAQDTLNHIIARTNGAEAMERMGIETFNFSRYLVYRAVEFFLMAGGVYANHYDLARGRASIAEAHREIHSLLVHIAAEPHLMA